MVFLLWSLFIFPDLKVSADSVFTIISHSVFSHSFPLFPLISFSSIPFLVCFAVSVVIIHMMDLLFLPLYEGIGAGG